MTTSIISSGLLAAGEVRMNAAWDFHDSCGRVEGVALGNGRAGEGGAGTVYCEWWSGLALLVPILPQLPSQ